MEKPEKGKEVIATLADKFSLATDSFSRKGKVSFTFPSADKVLAIDFDSVVGRMLNWRAYNGLLMDFDSAKGRTLKRTIPDDWSLANKECATLVRVYWFDRMLESIDELFDTLQKSKNVSNACLHLLEVKDVCIVDGQAVVLTEAGEEGKVFLSKKKKVTSGQIASILTSLIRGLVFLHSSPCCVFLTGTESETPVFTPLSLRSIVFTDESTCVPFNYIGYGKQLHFGDEQITACAPEYYYKKTCGEKTDVWGVGMLMLALHDWGKYSELSQILPMFTYYQDETSFDFGDNIPEPVLALIRQCLKANAEERISLSALFEQTQAVFEPTV